MFGFFKRFRRRAITVPVTDVPVAQPLTVIEQVARTMYVFQVASTMENWKLYSALIREELGELDRETRKKVVDREAVLKESADLLWVVLSKLLLEFTPEQIEEAIARVAESNLSKAAPDTLQNREALQAYIATLDGDYSIVETELDGETWIFVKNTTTGKYQKGPNYKKPVLTDLAVSNE